MLKGYWLTRPIGLQEPAKRWINQVVEGIRLEIWQGLIARESSNLSSAARLRLNWQIDKRSYIKLPDSIGMAKDQWVRNIFSLIVSPLS